MVDVVGLRFVAEGERDATNALKRYAAAQDKLKRSILDAASQVQRSASDWERANKLYDQGVLSAKALQAAHTQAARALAVLNGYVTKSGAVNTQRAAKEIRAAQATRESAKAAEEKARAEMQAAASYRQLKAAVDPAYAAQMRLSAAEETLNAAVLRGVISREEATRTLRQYQAQAEQTTRVVQGQAAATMFASRAQNASGMAMQQVGYQVGDFLVQVQSGTNAMVAFGQQATQLVGVLPMFGSFMGLSGTALIGLSAGLGIAIPLLTALGAFLMRAGDSAATLSEEVKALNTDFDEASAALDRLEDKDLAQTFGDYTAAVQGMSAAMLELNAAAAVTNLVSTFDAMESFAQTGVLENIKEGFFNIGRVINPFAGGEGLFGIVTPEQLDREKFELLGYDMGREQFLDYVEGLKQAAARGDIDEVAQLVRTFFADAMDGTEAVSLQGLGLLRNMEASALAAAEFAARQNGSAQAAKDAAEAEKQRLQFLREEEGLFSAHVDAYKSSLEAEKQRLQFLREEEGLFSAHVDAYKSVVEARMAGEDVYAQHVKAYQEEQAAAAEGIASRQAALLEENTRFEAEQEKKRAIARAEGDAARIAAINLYYDNREQAAAEAERVEAARAAIRKQRAEDEAALQKAMAQQVADQQAALLEENARYERATQAQVENFNAQNQSLQDQLNLTRTIAQFGQDSAEVRALQLEQEIAARKRSIDAQVAENRLSADHGNLIKALVEELLRAEAAANATADEVAGIAPGLQAAIDQANAFADAMGRARAESAGIGISTAGLQAQAAALEGGASRAEATATAAATTLRERLVAESGGTVGRGTGARIEQQVAERYDAVLQRELAQERVRALTATTGGTSGSSAGAAAAQDDYLQNLLQEAEQKRRLVGLSEEETRRQEILFELKKRELPLNYDRIEQIIQTEAETRKLIEAEQQREQLMQTIEGNIKSAFMSMVDGSQSVEDAFRNMLRNILLAVYEQQVAQPAATAIGSLISGLFNANGNVFSGGSRVTAYANGGVVNSPTYFPMSSGVGLMGEAGPEAIMPLKRGANGKLGVQVDGNAGNVTVNQYFQIAANGDDSVRRIVRQEAPRIAEQAKAAVVDAKRRGGAYGRSF